MSRKRRLNEVEAAEETEGTAVNVENPDNDEQSEAKQAPSDAAMTDEASDATKDDSLYEHHKRPAARPRRQGKRDLYIMRESNFIVSCKRVRKLLDSDKGAVTLHGMGAAMTRCCDIALSVQRDYGNRVSLSVDTGTISVVDDFEPLVEGLPEVSRNRNTSCIRVTLRRTASFV